MTDWRRLAEHFEEKASITQMWLNEAMTLLDEVYLDDEDRQKADDLMERYEREKDR